MGSLKKFFIIDKAHNGHKALNKVEYHQKNCHNSIHDDINMPIMDRLEASEKIDAFLEDHNLQALLDISSKRLSIPNNYAEKPI